MEQVCTRLTYTLCIGIIALIGYAVNTGDGKEGVARVGREDGKGRREDAKTFAQMQIKSFFSTFLN